MYLIGINSKIDICIFVDGCMYVYVRNSVYVCTCVYAHNMGSVCTTAHVHINCVLF